MINLDKRDEAIGLYECYDNLLTDKQKNYFEAYYYDDLSLAEIASNFDVSRNAVFDQIKKTISILEHYEECLHILKKNRLLNKALEIDDANEIKEILKSII